MRQVLHGCARTTAAVRRAIQNSQESLRALAKRYGINQKTVAKWKKRESADRSQGSQVDRPFDRGRGDHRRLSAGHTLLPLDDCLYALQPAIPRLTRSSLHRCLQRHGISRLPDTEGDKPQKKKFKAYLIGYFHIDIAEIQTAEGKLYLYVAISRASKFAFVQLVEKTGRTSASIRTALPPEQWERVAPLLPGKAADPGATAKDNRLFLEGVLWIVRTGSPWRDLPEAFGKWNSVWRRFRRFALKGVFERIFSKPPNDPDFEYVIIDGTIVRVHQHAASAKGGLKIRPSAVRKAA